MTILSSCPPAERFHLLLLGLIAEEQAPPLEAHLSHCSGCQAIVRELSLRDELTEALRSRMTLSASDCAAMEDLIPRMTALCQQGSTSDLTPHVLVHTWTDRTDSGDAMAHLFPQGLLAPPEVPGDLGRLGPYRVIGVLGCGGMSMVFRALDTALDREVALKVATPRGGPLIRERFQREARVMAKLRHEGVAQVYQAGEDNGVCWLAMELLHGEPLDKLAERQGRLPADEVIRIGSEVALALAEAHRMGLIHRDIKPGNLWREPSGRIKVLDFGLVRQGESDRNITGEGMILGTPAYMAPEQARGARADARSDLFSLGGVLYRLATGQEPFTGTDAISTILAVSLSEVVPASEVCPEVPARLSALIARMLSKLPEHRPASATDVALELAAITMPELPVPKPRRRVWPLAGMAVAAALLLTAGALLFWKGEPDPVDTTPPEQTAPVVASGGSVLDRLDPKHIPISERFPWQPKELRAVLGSQRQQHWGEVRSLVYHPQGNWLASVALYDSRLCFWDATDLRLLRVIDIQGRDGIGLTLSPDRQTLVVPKLGGRVGLMDVSGPEPRGLPTLPVNAFMSVWHPNRPLLACVEYDALTLVDRSAAEPRLLSIPLPKDKNSSTGLAITADGQILACGRSDGTVLLWDIQEPQPRELPPLLLGKIGPVSLRAAPGGRRLAVWSERGPVPAQAWLVDLADEKRASTHLVAPAPIANIAFSRDGKTMVAGCLERLRVWDIEGSRAKERLTLTTPQDRDGSIACTALALSDNGDRVFIGEGAGAIRAFDIVGPQAIERPAWNGSRGGARLVEFSRSGDRLAVRNRQNVLLDLWSLAGEEPRLLSGVPRDQARGLVTWSSASERVLAAADYHLTLWDVTKEKARTLDKLRESAETEWLCYAPDGKRVAVGWQNQVALLSVDSDTLKIHAKITLPGGQSSHRGVFSPDGKTLVVCPREHDANSPILLLEVGQELRVRRSLVLPNRGRTGPPVFSPDGKLLCVPVMSGQHIVYVVDLEQPTTTVRATLATWVCAFTPDSKTLAVTNYGDHGVRFFDLPAAGGPVQKDPLRPWAEWQFPGNVLSLAVSPCGKYVATGNSNGRVFILALPPRGNALAAPALRP